MQEDKVPKVRERRVIFESRKFLVVEKDMEFSNGDTETWEAVELKGKGGARVLALTDTQELLFIKEYRGAAEKYVVRFPTGLIEEGEEPKEAAGRELQEETGFVADNLEFLVTLGSTSGYYKGSPTHVFFGSGLRQTGVLAREPGEVDMELLPIPLEKAFQMAENAEFEDPQTLYLTLLLRRYLASKA